MSTKIPRFTDKQGRTWPLEITVGTVRDLRRMLDVDLLSINDAEADLIERLSTDAELLCNVLYVVCIQQCKETGVSDEDFGRALDGDAIRDATVSLDEAINRFFQNPRQAAIFKLLMGRKSMTLKMSRLLDHVWNDAFLKQAESSESTHAASA